MPSREIELLPFNKEAPCSTTLVPAALYRHMVALVSAILEILIKRSVVTGLGNTKMAEPAYFLLTTIVLL
jgi:hypothetical protein